MSARFDNPTVNAAAGAAEMVPDLIIPEVTATAARQEVFMPLVRKIDVTGPGETFTVPTAGALAFAQLGGQTYIDGADPVETAFNTGGRTFTPYYHFLDVVVPMDVIQGSNLSVQDAVVKEAGIGLAKYRDGLFAAIYTEAPASTPDHEIGTDATELSMTSLRDGITLLYTQLAPKPFAWVVYPTQVGELMKDDTFINASVKGSGVLNQRTGPNGYVTSVLDVDVYMCDQIKESSGRHSMMFSKNAAYAWVYKRIGKDPGNLQELMMDIDWNSSRRSYEINMTVNGVPGGLYGTSTTTNNWIVDIIS